MQIISSWLGVVLTFLFFLRISFALTDGDRQYLTEIPFLPAHIKPLVVIDMDYSGSMQFPAYYACRFYGYYNSQVAECGYVITDYDTSKNYYGYFDSGACYSYNTQEGFWEKSDCDCSANGGIGTEKCLSGNFLNFLTTTRMDVALKALIGGKAKCDENGCILRSQGARRTVQLDNLNCLFYIQPENYSEGSYNEKDIVIYARNL